MSDENLSAALAEWRVVLGADLVLDGASATARYTVDTSRFARRLGGALRVRERGQVAALLRIAQRHRTPLYTISRGNDWGYGTANPVVAGAKGCGRPVEAFRAWPCGSRGFVPCLPSWRAAYPFGSTMVKVEPCPGRLSTLTRPPCAFTMARTKLRPRPRPRWERLGSAR